MKKFFTCLFFTVFCHTLGAVGVITYMDNSTTMGKSSSVSQVTLPSFSDLNYIKSGYRIYGWATTASKATSLTCDAGYVGDSYEVINDITLYAVTEEMTYDESFKLADATNPLQAGDRVMITCQNGNGDGKGYILHNKITKAVDSKGCWGGYIEILSTFNASLLDTYDEGYQFFIPYGTTSKIVDRFGNVLQIMSGYMNLYLYASDHADVKTSKNVNVTFQHISNGNYKILTFWGTNYFLSLWYNSGAYKLRNEYNDYTSNQWQSATTVVPAIPSLPPYAFTIYRYTRAYDWMVTLKSGNGANERLYRYGKSVQLPVNAPFAAPEGQDLEGWTDGENTYLPGEVISLTSDITLTAVYAAPKVFFEIGEHGGSAINPMSGSTITLPSVTPESGYKFMGWATSSDAKIATYCAGQTFPVTKNVLLYAVYDKIESIHCYELVTSTSQINSTGQYVLTISDGNPTGTVCYGVQYIYGGANTKDWNTSSVDETFLLTFPSAGSDKYYIRPVSNPSAYLYASSTQYQGSVVYFQNPSSAWTLTAVDAAKGRWKLTCGFDLTYNQRNDMLLTNNDDNSVDQYAAQKSLAEIRYKDKKGARVWNIYRHIAGNRAYASFVVQNGQLPDRPGPDVILPNSVETPAPSNQAIDYWEDANGTHYQPGSPVFVAGADKTFTAVYRSFRLNYHVENGTCSRAYDTDATVTLPDVTPAQGFRFLGWASTPNATKADVGKAGDEYSYSQETILYAVVMDVRVWVPVTAYSEVQNKECLFTMRSASPLENECYALQQGNFDALDLMPYWHHGVLKDVPAQAILNTSNNLTYSYYDNEYKQQNLYVTAQAGTPQWINTTISGPQFSWDDATKSFTYSGYSQYGYNKSYYKLVVTPEKKWEKLDNGVSTTNQFTYNYSLNELWTNSKYASQLTLWKRVELPVITFDVQGGKSDDMDLGYGFIEHLPTATKAGYLLYGWSDGENIYQPGKRYPISGYVSSDVTLTAVFRSAEIQESWANSFTDLSVGDNVCLVIADGNGGANKFGFIFEAENKGRLEPFDANNIPAYMWATIIEKNEENHTIVLQNTKGLYLCSYSSSFRTYVDRTNAHPIWVLNFDAQTGHFDFTNSEYSAYYLVYKSPTEVILTNSNLANQYTDAKALATERNSSKFPKMWTMYKRSIIYTSTVSFDAGEHGTYLGGNKVGTNTSGVILPELNSLADEYYFYGWYDGVDTLAAGVEYRPSNDITLTAVYERKQARFVVDGYGTWDDMTTNEKVFIGIKDNDSYKVDLSTLPKVLAKFDHRFIGWSTDPNATIPTFTSRDIISVDVPTTYYAVLMQYVHSVSYELADSNNPIQSGDSLIILAEDGIENGLCYAWQTQANNSLNWSSYQGNYSSEIYLISINKNDLQTLDRKYHFKFTSSASNIYQFSDAFGNSGSVKNYDVSIDNTSDKRSIEILPLNIDKGLYSLRNTAITSYNAFIHYFYNSYYSRYYARYMTAASDVMIDQIDHHIALSAAQVGYKDYDTYPYAWTIYRRTDRINYRVTLLPGEGTGEILQMDAYQISLPTNSPFTPPAGKDVCAWYDAENDVTYTPGQQINLTRDITLTAQYSIPQIIFVVNKYGNPINPLPGPYVTALPNCTTPQTHKFIGWSTAPETEEAEYAAGERFPKTGTISSNTVLYAVIQERGREAFFELVTDNSQLTTDDKYVFAIQDGNANGKNIFALSYYSPSSPDLKIYDWSTKSSDETFLFKLSQLNPKVIVPSTDASWYICVSSKSEGSPVWVSRASDKSWTFNAIDAAKGLYHIDMGSYHLSYAGTGDEDIKLTSTGVNQFATRQSLSSVLESGQYATAWNIYRYVWTYNAYANFIVENGSISPRKGGDVTLPISAETPAPEGKGLDYWLDEDDVTQYQPGEVVFVAGEDKFYTAVYRPYRINYVTAIGEVSKDYDLTSPATLPSVSMPTGYRFLGWATTANASTPDAGYAGDEYVFTQETTLYAVTEQMATCDKYIKATTREQNVDYIIAFEDGDGGPNGYAMTIKDNSFRFEPLNLQNPNPNHIFRVNSQTLFEHVETGKKLSTTGGTYPDLSVDGGYGLTYEQATNGGWQFSYIWASKKKWLTYSGSDWVDTRNTNIVDQWNTHQSLQEVVNDEKGAYNITLYKRTTALAYKVTYVSTPGNFTIATDEACLVYLPTADEMPMPYSNSFLGWAVTPEKAAWREIDYLPGALFTPERDITLYAVFAYIPEYTILEWKADGVVIQTVEPATQITTQVEGEVSTNNTLSSCKQDAGIYKLSTTSLIGKVGQTLSLAFSNSESSLGAGIETIPYITDNQEETLTEIASTSDIVVLPNTKLTINASLTVGDITVMGDGKLVIPEGKTLTVNHLYLRAGHPSNSKYSTYEYTYPQLAVEGTLNISCDTIYLDYLLNKKQQYTFAVPVAVKRADIKASTGEEVTFKVAEYNGAIRATGGNGWGYTEATTFEPGVGYTIFATPLTVIGADGFPTKQTYVTLRIPMVVGDSYTENAPRSVAVHKYPSTQNATLADWNLVSVPYMCNYKGALSIGDIGQTYVTIPDDLGSSYTNVETDDDTELLPAFKNFFVQAAAEGNLEFSLEHRIAHAPWMAPQEKDDYRTGIILTNGTVTDKVGLLIGKDYTPAYETNADLAKWMNAVLSVYAIVDNNELAYAAINHDMAAQAIPIGYKTTKSGTYTFSLNRKYDASLVKAVWLMDNELGYVTDLLLEDYVFTTKATTDNKRFAIAVERAEYHAPTGTQTTSNQKDGDCYDIFGRKMLPNQLAPGQIYIMGNEKFVK